MDDAHEICRLREEIAVLKEQAKGAAMALVLAERLHSNEKKTWVAIGLGLLALTSRFIK